MGLTKTLKAVDPLNSYCADIEDVYFKIEGVHIDTEREKVRIKVRGWLSEYARHNQGIGVYKRVFYAPIEYYKDTKATIDELKSKSYEYIKELPEFNTAADELEDYSGSIDITEETVEEQKKDLEELIAELKG